MRKLPLLIIIAASTAYAQTDSIYLETIPFNTLTLLYKRYAREIYANEDRSLYYKVWDHDYLRSSFFLGAVKAGFFNGLAPLISIIYDKNNQCRSYVTTGGIVVRDNANKSGLKINSLGHITPTAQQTNKHYIEFYKRLLSNSIRSQYAFVDMPPQNIIEIDTQFYLIDLESVLPFSYLEKPIVSNPGYVFCIKEYARDLQLFLDRKPC